MQGQDGESGKPTCVETLDFRILLRHVQEGDAVVMIDMASE